MLESAVAEYSLTGVAQERTPGIVGVSSPTGTFRSKDGKWLVLTCSTDGTFANLARAMHQPELVTDSRFASNGKRVANNAELEPMVAAWLGGRSWNEIRETLDAEGVPVCLINSMADIFKDRHYRFRESLVEVEHPVFGKMSMPGITPKLSRTPGEIRWIGPELGAHNNEVYAGLLGMKSEDIKALREQGIC
jgi:formyl-CoA transferase